ncbi:MAG: tRNA 2-thiouridine(34) synthase MnmA, partial [Pseudomonadota bacterium]|nr:tRNA 2-thiouridine(34) synthase MnmA [Pseudomonadota bacterium]
HEVIGLFMRNWEDDDGFCPAKQDFLDVAAVTDKLGIDLEAVDFSSEYKERVFSYFLTEYNAGRTPNPDILCNSEIKFKAFLDHALKLGADFIATGHYARIQYHDGRPFLCKAYDKNKDQSYFLYRLKEWQLEKTIFPLGELNKPTVRDLARTAGLIVHDKKDSTGICFIGERPFRAFLSQYLKGTPGPIKTAEGKTIGEHVGLMFYTIGQRQGLGIGGPGAPWFVAGKDLKNNTLTVVQGRDHPLLKTLSAWASDLSFINNSPLPEYQISAKTRYRQSDASCLIQKIQDTQVEVRFNVPQWAVTPGQSLVLYDREVCLGGGILV